MSYDAVVVGAGPNGLVAAIELARAGLSVVVVEGQTSIGGGSRSEELTLPGFVHDVCSAVHPLAVASPVFRSMPLADHGLSWVHPPLPLAHPFDGGEAAVLHRSLEDTAARLGSDGATWRSLFQPLVRAFDAVMPELLGSITAGRIASMPSPAAARGMLRFATLGFRSAAGLARTRFDDREAPALFCGMAAHAMLPLTASPSAGFGLILGLLAHSVGWPIPRGGSQKIADALVSYLRSLGGELRGSTPVRSLADLPPARVALFDVTPRQLLGIAGDRLPERFRRRLRRFRYGLGVFKVDWSLSGPVPWSADPCRQAGTVHLGGSHEELIAGEAEVASGRVPQRPYVLITQPSLFDGTRAPEGHHTLWAYCHVPNASRADMTAAIEAQIERFAPGFRELVLGRSVRGPSALEAHNENLVGGDINGGLQDLRTMFLRPSARWSPYTTPDDGIYICSSSTPPGGGVHGMCGQLAARAVLRRAFRD